MRADEIVLVLIERGRLKVDCASGDVYSMTSNCPSKPLGAITAKGYLRVCLSVGGCQYWAMVHRIVWIAGHGILGVGLQIDHRNGIKTDNRLANLDAVSGAENMRRAAVLGLAKGGRRNAPRNSRGQFKKAAGRLLDGWEWNDMPGKSQ